MEGKLSLRDQGRVREQDPRVLDQPPDEIESRITSSLAVGALEDAVATRDDVTGSMVHSDRGSQFRNQKLPHALAHHRLIRIDRSSRLPQRQHRQGKLLQPVTEEHPHPPLPDHP